MILCSSASPTLMLRRLIVRFASTFRDSGVGVMGGFSTKTIDRSSPSPRSECCLIGGSGLEEGEEDLELVGGDEE
jgi:hypothetical protein